MYALFYTLCFVAFCYGLIILVVRCGLALVQQNINVKDDLPFVSIVVAVRNKSETVLNCLNALIHQDYPRHLYEIIVVDDASDDCTRELLIKFSQKAEIIVLQNPTRSKYQSSKKAALEFAITTSRADIVLFTDADCFPPSSWMKCMIHYFGENVGLVAGFSPQKTTNRPTCRIMEIDAAAAAIVSAATIGFSRGVTCTGRNLAYRKKALEDIGGFAALPDSVSGDDDFIAQAIAKHPKWCLRYVLDPNAVVPAVGPDNLPRFLHQKKRHLSAGQYFPMPAQLGFAVYHLANLLLWAITLAGIWVTPLVLIPFSLKFLFDYLLLQFFLAKHHLHLPLWSFVLWEIIFAYYNAVLGPSSMLRKVEW